MAPRHRVLILGGGFGGLNAAQKLKRAPVEVTLIDRRNFHLFQPLMYQVATGSLSPGEIAAPLRGVLSHQKNAQVLLGEAVDIDPDAKRVTLRDGAEFEYDSLIVATGSKTSYYGNDAWREWAPSLKTVEEATAIRHKILYAFEWAERAKTAAEAQAWLTFVIVGAGATGMELAGALAEIARETLKHDFRHINPTEARIILAEGGPRVLASYPEDLSAKAEKLVTKLGVEVRKGVMVTDIDQDGVTYKIGDQTGKLAAKTVLWGGGVITTEFGKKLGERTKAPTDKQGRIKVLSRSDGAGVFEHFCGGGFGGVRWETWKAAAGSRAGGDARWHLRVEGDSREAGGKARVPGVSLFRQGRHGGDWEERGGREHFRVSCVGISGLVHLVVHPLDVSRGISESRDRFHAVGTRVSDV